MSVIRGNTQLLGLIGQPVSHSLSPAMHNAAIAAMKLNYCYIPLPCESNNLATILQSLRELNFQGLNITIPHKTHISEYCKKLSPIAQRVNAVNTLLPDEHGGWIGTNTDVEGFIAPLKEDQWEAKKAMVIGCGGSSRAVIVGLQDLKMSQITIVGRKTSSLKKCLEDLSNQNSSAILQGILEQDNALPQYIKNADLIVNSTPVGMAMNSHSNSQSKKKMPLGEEIWHTLKPSATLYDLIYTPRPTAWLTWGKQNGFKQIDGLEMLVQQGAASLKLWSGAKTIPINLMRQTAENFLAN